MKECRSIVEATGERCRRPAATFSPYCWHHRETTWLVGFVGTSLTALGFIAMFFIFLWQERAPHLSARCEPPPDGSPSELICTVKNSGWRESRDPVVSFTNMLPLQTRVWAAPETGVQMQEADVPPVPVLKTTLPALRAGESSQVVTSPSNTVESAAAKFMVAFVVKIPRVAARDSITFQVATVNPDNERAAKQTMRIREQIKAVISKFSERLSTAHPEAVKGWNLTAVLSGRVKEEGFFTPGRLSYEGGRVPVGYLTEDEELAKAVQQDLYRRYKSEFLDVFQGRPEFRAPVIRIRTPDGEATYAIMPPYIDTYVLLAFPMPAPGEHGSISLQPPVPDSYE
jgi:hypothetical protein